MKLTLYACVNDAQHVRKEWGTREREIRNTLEGNGEQVRKKCATREKGMLEQVGNDSQTGETMMFCR
ncbi:MAG: hypothetical protein HXO51_07115 [Prevotella sp.]|nr:hypothetical protein [Prevotella sp.]